MTKKVKSWEFDNGSVKGLLVGINYIGTSAALGGCINDVHKVKSLIESNYPTAELEVMTDHTPKKPTRDNILTALKALVAGAKRGDTIIFDYSGHGSQVQDIHGDEEDGLDETLCPIDFRVPRTITYQGRRYHVDSQITNDEIHEIITGIPHGARFFMLSDSCHSGTIGQLKNDFARYHGPEHWGQDNCDNKPSSQVSPSTPAPAPLPDPVPTKPTNNYYAPTVVEKINCYASWAYYTNYGRRELVINPYDADLIRKFNHQKLTIQAPSYAEAGRLYYYTNKAYICKTTFEKLNNGAYRVSCPDIDIKDLTVSVPGTSPYSSYYNPSRNIKEEEQCNVSSHYDPVNGKHIHVDNKNKEKRSLKMRSHNSCNGGELRIISGCQESQTSADTGRNGACTLSFLNTVQSIGGLKPFFKKLFSHHIETMKVIQDSINTYLSRHGYTQQSVLSWDHGHSHANRGLGGVSSSVANAPMHLNRRASMPEQLTNSVTPFTSHVTPFYNNYLTSSSWGGAHGYSGGYSTAAPTLVNSLSSYSQPVQYLYTPRFTF
jgi:hypothetical protein